MGKKWSVCEKCKLDNSMMNKLWVGKTNVSVRLPGISMSLLSLGCSRLFAAGWELRFLLYGDWQFSSIHSGPCFCLLYLVNHVLILVVLFAGGMHINPILYKRVENVVSGQQAWKREGQCLNCFLLDFLKLTCCSKMLLEAATTVPRQTKMKERML